MPHILTKIYDLIVLFLIFNMHYIHIFFLFLLLVAKSLPWLGISSLLISFPTIIQIAAQVIFFFTAFPEQTNRFSASSRGRLVGPVWGDGEGVQGRWIEPLRVFFWAFPILNNFHLSVAE